MLQTQHTHKHAQMKGVCTVKLSSSFCSTLPQDKYVHEESLCSTSYLEFWSTGAWPWLRYINPL